MKKLFIFFLLLILLQGSCNPNNSNTNSNDTIPTALNVNPNPNKRWHELQTYQIEHDGKYILVTAPYAIFMGDIWLDGSLTDIYNYLNSSFRSGDYHIYFSYWDDSRDKYGNPVFAPAEYITTVSADEAKKFRSLQYFNEYYQLVRKIQTKLYEKKFPEKLNGDISNELFYHH